MTRYSWRMGLVVAMFAIATSAPAHANACSTAEISISAPPLSRGDQRAFVEKFRTELAKVCDWWGGDFAGPYRIEIEDSRGTSMALIPAWRGNHGQVIFRMRTIRQGNSPITHEIVHAVAPNGNRFLAEGLATHAHTALGGQSAFPNFGNDLHARAAQLADDANMPALERLAVPARLQLPDLPAQGSYIVAGSFVRFLIETHGMEKFRALYELTPLVPRGRFAGLPQRWDDIYGIAFEELVDAWRVQING